MTKRDILSVAIKVLGVICALYALISVKDAVLAFASKSGYHPWAEFGKYWYINVGQAVGITVLLFVAALVMLLWGDGIARRLSRDDSQIQVPGGSEWGGFVFTLALRIVGVVAVLGGVRDLGVVGATYAVGRGLDVTISPELVVRYWAAFTTALAMLVLGGYLLTGAKHLVRLLYPAQKGGTQPCEEK
jgi:hypothetical protein